MDMPTEETPAPAYLPRSAYTIARVAADPKAAGLEAALRVTHTKLKNALREYDDLEEQEEEKAATFDAADDACDNMIEGFELHLLAAVGKNRDNIKYSRYFKNGLRAVTQADARDVEPNLVSDIIGNLSNDENDADIGTVAKEWRPKLQNVSTQVTTAEGALNAVEKARTHLKETTIDALKAEWREEYKKLEGALIGVYANDPKRVARFFKPFRRSRKSPKNIAPPAPATPAATP